MPQPRHRRPGPGAFHTTAAANFPPDSKPVVIDASGLVVGRMATNIAKRLLNGDRVFVVNAENAVITGSRDAVFDEYGQKRARGTPRKGPFFPRMPDQIVKRTIRGMLPYQRGNGRAAFRRLRVYIGKPEDIKGPTLTVEEARTHAARTVTVGEVSKQLGARF
jgi:large subunit ribosomal protein L13